MSVGGKGPLTGVIVSAESDALNAAALAFAGYSQNVQDRFASAAAAQLTDGWTEELHAAGAYNAQQESIVTRDPGSSFSGRYIKVWSGGTGFLGQFSRAFEFGANREQFVSYTGRSPLGLRYPVTRRTRRQLPPIHALGWIAYPAMGRWRKRAFGMAFQILVKVAHDAAEGVGAGG